MPRLVRLFLVHGAIGVMLGAVFTGLILWFDIAQIGSLVARSPEGWLAALMLVCFSGITFGGVQIGIVIMNMAEPDEHDPFGGKGDAVEAEPVEDPLAIAVPVRTDRR